MFVPAIVVGAVWVNYKKPWLMDDYRSGYAQGGALLDVIVGPDDASEQCAELMAQRYEGPPDYDQYVTPEPASAFWWGCFVAANGGENDWWNVSGYLTA